MKTRVWVLALVFAALCALAVPTAAYANFAIHGNYVTDTDACAGCHRAHTSVSTLTWQDTVGPNDHSALLVTSATRMYEFCYACHDATSQGADTNVEEGIYEGSLYGTQFAILNGGGFASLDQTATTSTHEMRGAGWGAFGGGYFGTGSTFAADYSNAGQGAGAFMTGTGNEIRMECTTCHDPHGSANYRILKAYVNGNYVGGYQPSGNPVDPNPDGFVSSVETGWPVNGFRLHTAYPAYRPNYTTAMYAKGYNQAVATLAAPATGLETTRGMSAWCTGCHSTYLGQVQTFSKVDPLTSITVNYQSLASTYNAGDGSGLALRHKHPINVELTTYNGPDKASMVITDLPNYGIPVAHDIDEQGVPVSEATDWVECLTCHRAHGTSAIMTGYASAAGAASVLDTDGVPRNLFPANEVSALLRRDNRGVCEACHNK